MPIKLIAPTEWMERFRNLLNIKPKIDPSLGNNVENILKSDNTKICNTLCFKIPDLEITSAVCALKNGKAAGIDGVPNKTTKASFSFLKPSLHSILMPYFFMENFQVFGALTHWLHSTKKGSILLRYSNRGIALSGCLAKLFLSVLHKRLYKFADENNFIPAAQIGYKKGARAADHILTVDFKSAFYSVWRDGLFHKLLQMGIGGNFLTVLSDPDSKVHGANMGPIWGRQDPGGSHVGPMNFAIWGVCILRWNTVWNLMVWFHTSFLLILVSNKDVYWIYCCLICILLICHAYLMKPVIPSMFTHCLPIVCFLLMTWCFSLNPQPDFKTVSIYWIEELLPDMGAEHKYVKN